MRHFTLFRDVHEGAYEFCIYIFLQFNFHRIYILHSLIFIVFQSDRYLTTQLDSAEAIVEGFFKLPLEAKRRYNAATGKKHGYTEIGVTRLYV